MLLRFLPVAVGGAVTAQWAPACAAGFQPVARAFGIRTRAPAATSVLLSFDDGPHAEGTPAVLAALERAGAHAVFFVCGEQVERRPEVVREIVAAGHALGLHGYRHQTRRQWTRKLLSDDIHRAIDVVAAATGTAPHLYRPPHGVFSLPGLQLIRELGLEPLLWSKWGRDWESRATPDSIARRATRGIAAGDIVLLHDADHYASPGSWRATVSSLPLVFAALERAGLDPGLGS